LVSSLNSVSAEIARVGDRIIEERSNIQAVIDLLGTDAGTLESQMGILDGLVLILENENEDLETDNSDLQAQVSEYTS
jgi:hypothetical protein